MLLVDLLPDRHKNSPETAQIQQAMQNVADDFADAYDEMIQQLNASTATSWIDIWECAYGILPDVSKPLDYRRTRLISKMRGSGATTAQLIQNVAESFSNGAVEIIETPAESRFQIKFVGTLGIPPNMDDLSAAIEEIKPAHLAYAYIIIYRTWAQLKTKTWGYLKSYTWAQVKGGDIGD